MEDQKVKAREQRVKASRDYDLFNYLEDNRPLLQYHVKRLKQSVERSNDLHLHPIVVTPEMAVIDGQHRLEVSRILNVPIYYVIDENYRSEKIMLLNSNQKNWSVENYIEYWCNHGKSDYKRLKKLQSTYEIPYIVLLDWIGGDSKRSKTKSIREGKLRIPEKPIGLMYLEQAFELFEIMKEKNYRPVKIYSQRTFNMALKKIFSSPIFELERFYERLEKWPYEIKYTTHWRDYVDQLADIYNYKMSKDVMKVVRSHNKVELIK